jgi:hypothetical protein
MGEKCASTYCIEGVLSVHCPSASSSQKTSQAIRTQVCYVMNLELQDYFHEISARFSYLTTLYQSDVNYMLNTSVNKFLLFLTGIW